MRLENLNVLVSCLCCTHFAAVPVSMEFRFLTFIQLHNNTFLIVLLCQHFPMECRFCWSFFVLSGAMELIL